MSTETLSTPDTLPSDTLGSPLPGDTQNFSDNDIMDNFADGANDPTPLGIGGEKGRQSEPASATLEADMVRGTGNVDPVDPTDVSTDNQSVDDVPELPPVLLQMAGYASADDAIADGIDSASALQAFVRGRGQLLAAPTTATGEIPADFYRQPFGAGATAPTNPVAQPQPSSDLKPFEMPEETLEMLDPELSSLVVGMNNHYQAQIAALQGEATAKRQFNESAEFDKAVVSLGKDWTQVFGEGEAQKLAQAAQRDPMAFANVQHRRMLFEDVQAIRKVNEQRGFAPMTSEQEIQFALMNRYPERFKQTISGPGRAGVTASRPTQRRTPPKNQGERTLAAVNKALAKKGSPPLDMGDGVDFTGDI